MPGVKHERCRWSGPSGRTSNYARWRSGSSTTRPGEPIRDGPNVGRGRRGDRTRLRSASESGSER
ncbi:hypothetical protein C791_1759 [Amycolatopsis azurea DSM 43854]|uniref:Uncharacterized protein n=1 Tax=Amycolatopsis azurea DSM 43854 TaxID=1238180 RepID=M2QPW7_9PSEU|nr:hypothetical protein C791_1759 [Amycolatopsis azurea DSM 43854]